MPTTEEDERMSAVAKRLHAHGILLATWKKGAVVVFSRYHPQATKESDERIPVSDLDSVFR